MEQRRRGGGGVVALKTGLISFWELGEVSGARADAVVASANNLTDNNTVTQTTGKVGNCAQFTAANSEQLTHATNASLEVGGQDFSLAGWVNLNDLSERGIVSKAGAFANNEYVIEKTFNGSHVLNFTVMTNGGQTNNELFSTATVSTATWTFFAATFTASSGAMTLSINAGTRNTATAINLPVSSSTRDFAIGFGAGAFLDGLVDQVGFWKKVLTTAEEAQLYNAGAGLSYAAM